MSDAAAQPPKENVKETLISIIIAFVLAFVFRGFVVEAFVIPTGSMAPTLLGQHMRFEGASSGNAWTVGPWNYMPGSRDPVPLQGVPPADPVVVHDPMTGERSEQRRVPLRAGDRILVLKYLYALHDPERYDVIVFKNPSEPGVNFIKRLIGLPNEQLALVDGDVFVRPTDGHSHGPVEADWTRSDWTVAAKPDAAAREVWQPVFDSAYTPLSASDAQGQRWFNPPWKGEGWQTADTRFYTHTGTGPSRLDWDASTPLTRSTPGPHGSRTGETWAINDRTAYNENPTSPNPPMYPRYPIGDIRLRASLEFPDAGRWPEWSAIVIARGHEFRALVSAGTVRLQMRPLGAGEDAWSTLSEGRFDEPAPGLATDVEFWHMDQTLEFWLNGRRVAQGAYRWTPAQRVEFATGRTLESILASGRPAHLHLSDPTIYRPSSAAWSFSGGPVRFLRVGLDRDLHYRPDLRRGSGGQPEPAWGAHPSITMNLGPDQYFACGDNSPASEDSRKWGSPDPWAALIDPTPGVVPGELLLGKAFFVYFPALAGDGGGASRFVPMPDFGRMRFIR
jgi:signal peptidase I